MRRAATPIHPKAAAGLVAVLHTGAASRSPQRPRFGVLNPLATGQGLRNQDLAAAICSAINDWQIEKWTSQDARLKGSIVFANEDGVAAATEIRKRAGDKNFVQVLLLSRNVEPLGQRRYWPDLSGRGGGRACGRRARVRFLAATRSPASGWPSFYIEEMVGHSQCQQTALASLVLEGVFERFSEIEDGDDRGGLRLGAVAGLGGSTRCLSDCTARCRI